MTKYPSTCKTCILKHTAFRAGPALRPDAMNTLTGLRATTKHTKLRWKITQQPGLAWTTSHLLPPQKTSTGAFLAMLSP
jgi:hypothetical protein